MDLRLLYDCDYIFSRLLQIAAEGSVGKTPYTLSNRHAMAMAAPELFKSLTFLLSATDKNEQGEGITKIVLLRLKK